MSSSNPSILTTSNTLQAGLWLKCAVIASTASKNLDVKPKDKDGNPVPGPTSPMTLVETSALAGSVFVVIQEFVRGSHGAAPKRSFKAGDEVLLQASSAFLKQNVLYVTLAA